MNTQTELLSLSKLTDFQRIYSECENVKSVVEICGFKFVSHSEIPKNECHMVQDGKLLAKIIIEQ